MTWLEFKTLVKDFLTVDGDRIGATKGIDGKIRMGVIDLQSFIPPMRIGQRNVYGMYDMVQEGEASLGQFPDEPNGVMAREIYWITKGCPCAQRPTHPYPWAHRMDLICGHPKIHNWQYLAAIDPYGREFMVFPKIPEDAEIWLYWDGLKSNFLDTDSVVFGEAEAEAVAHYVKAWISLEIDKDPVLHRIYDELYRGSDNRMGARTRLYLDWNRRRFLPYSETPRPDTGCASCSVDCCLENACTKSAFINGYFYLRNPLDSTLWHKVTIVGQVGVEQISIGDPETTECLDTCIYAKGTGYLFSGGYFHLLNTDTGKFNSLAIVGQDSQEMWQIDVQKGSTPSVSTSAMAYRFEEGCLQLKNLHRPSIWHPISLADI